jgi:predicted phosphodiesterase
MEHLYLWEWCNATWTDAAATERRLGLRRLECWLVHGAIPERHPQGTQSDQNLKECLFEHVFPWIDDDGRNNSEIMLERLRERRQRQDLPTLLLHGHTHIPYARGIRKDETTSRLLPIYYDEPIRLDEYDRITICPGSVGQPRNPDRETHAAFGILDAKELTFQFCRVTYNTSPTRQKMNNLNYDLKLMQYLTGANQTHPFWNGNPLWHAWARCYRWREGKGWEPISDDQGVER